MLPKGELLGRPDDALKATAAPVAPRAITSTTATSTTRRRFALLLASWISARSERGRRSAYAVIAPLSLAPPSAVKCSNQGSLRNTGPAPLPLASVRVG